MLVKIALPLTLALVVLAMMALPRRAVFAVPLGERPAAKAPAQTTSTPLIDRDVPQRVETATFAMG